MLIPIGPGCAVCERQARNDCDVPGCAWRGNIPEPEVRTFIVCGSACDHDFTGWRDFEDGNGGEQVCAKCGMGAMHHTLMTGT